LNAETNPTDLARGHWRYILTQFDVPEAALTGKHTACPSCGGEDRFRFDNKDGAGTFYCSGCGAGTGYALLMRLRGWDFPTALKEVKGLIKPDMKPDAPPAKIAEPERRASLNRLWKGGRHDAPEVVKYLNKRGITTSIAQEAAGVLRYNEKTWHRDRHEFVPAILAPVLGADRRPVSIHRTFLLGYGEKERKMMPPVGDMAGAGVWFGPRSGESLLVAEGIETTLAAMQLYPGIDTGVSAISAHGLETFTPPPTVKTLHVIADNDSSFTGQKAAFALAHRMAMARKDLDVIVLMPKDADWDMLDVLNNRGEVYVMEQA
jgi:putative DNA primase/helicase